MTKPYTEPRITGTVYVTNPANGYTGVAGTGLLISDGRLEVPVTVRRVKPFDLFANVTQRRLDQFQYRYDVCTWKRNGYTYRGPASFVISVGDDGLLNGFPPVSTLDGRLRAKIKSQNVNLAQTLAEYRQTSSMFTELAMDVVKTFRSLRSGRAFRDFVRILQRPRGRHELSIANRWLQYQYGIRPLMADLYGSAEALASKIRTGFYLHVRTSASENFAITYYPSGEKDIGGWRTSSYEWRGRAQARYKVSDPALKQLAQLGITNPALLVWELIPYSFVIDWLIPVGDFLSSLDALVGVTDLRVNRGYKIVKKFQGGMSGGGGYYQITSSVRNSGDTSLSFPRLAYKPSNSLKAVANGVALLRQLRR